MEQLKIEDTIDNGTIENVHIAPIGSFNGSDSEGNPIPEVITTEALNNLAEKLNTSDDVLCDIDHASCKNGLDRDTRAAGWFTKFVVDPIKGLFATLKLTRKGKELLENREYRYTSPTFILDQDGSPIELHSVALTNTPAFKSAINPILNAEPTEKDILNMTKEELKDLVKETLSELKSAEEKAEAVEEVKEEVAEAVVEETVAEEPKVEEACAENACGEKTEEVKNECDATVIEEVVAENACKNEDPVEQPKEEQVEEKKEEVIKIEALNAAPVPSIESTEKWQKLYGNDFINWFNNGMK